MNLRVPLVDRIADKFTAHTINLFRFDAGLRKRLRRMLAERVQRELVTALIRADPASIQRRAFRDRNVEALSEEAKTITRTGYRAVALAHDKAMVELAGVEEEFARTAVNRVVGTDLLTITVPDKRLKQIVRSTMIGSVKKKAVAADWWAGQAEDVRKGFTQAVNAGLEHGESISAIVQRVRGTQQAAFTDGVVKFKDAEALVRTSVMSVTQAVHMESYRANSDIIEGVEQLSTIDSRTTEICVALHGSSWTLDGKAFPDSPFQGDNPPYPRHWGERSILVPRLKSMRKMVGAVGERKAANIESLPIEVRDALNGQAAAATDFETFLNSQPDSFANKLIGKTKAQLWRDGKLKLSQLVDQTGRPLTIDGLRATVRSVTDDAIEHARAA